MCVCVCNKSGMLLRYISIPLIHVLSPAEFLLLIRVLLNGLPTTCQCVCESERECLFNVFFLLHFNATGFNAYKMSYQRPQPGKLLS